VTHAELRKRLESVMLGYETEPGIIDMNGFIPAAIRVVVQECAAEIDKYRISYGGNWPALENVAANVRKLAQDNP
jgi:hypothetical protein